MIDIPKYRTSPLTHDLLDMTEDWMPHFLSSKNNIVLNIYPRIDEKYIVDQYNLTVKATFQEPIVEKFARNDFSDRENTLRIVREMVRGSNVLGMNRLRDKYKEIHTEILEYVKPITDIERLAIHDKIMNYLPTHPILLKDALKALDIDMNYKEVIELLSSEAIIYTGGGNLRYICSADLKNKVISYVDNELLTMTRPRPLSTLRDGFDTELTTVFFTSTLEKENKYDIRPLHKNQPVKYLYPKDISTTLAIFI